VVDTVTPKPVLVAPAMATRTLGQRAGVRLFYAQRVGGVPVGNLVDVVSLQLYPEVGKGPESTGPLLAEARRILGLQGVAPDKPIWDTEINYGLQGGVPTPPAPREQQEANVATTYLLNAADGVARVFWYSWDLHTIANTDLVQKDDVTPTPAGAAFAEVSRWMVGSRVDSCGAAPGGVWACALQTPRGPAQVYWASKGSGTVTAAFDARTAETLGQTPVGLPLGGTTLQVGTLPVLVTSVDEAGLLLPPRQ
jgi:polysaccharide biosynthesis protein PslG